MKLNDRVAVVTGGGQGIGAALCERFADEGASVVVADIDIATAQNVARRTGGLALKTDVGVEAEIRRLVEFTLARHGRIDLFCSNAGIETGGGVDADDADWERIWKTNVLAHVYAARATLPHMVERGEGYLLQTASAAGLLTQIASAPYSVTKHAAVAISEYLAIAYGDRGIRVSVLCPQAVRTGMTRDGAGVAAVDGILEPEKVADDTMDAIREERFLILPHPSVQLYMQRKAGDYDRWIAGMRRLRRRFMEE